MITLVVPVYNQLKITDKFLYFVSLNTVLPKKIILIDDNSSENFSDLVKKYNKLPIEHIRHSKNEGVNYSWNEGMRLSETPYISVFNNDIIINKFFFKKIIETFELNDRFGIVCGNTVRKPKFVGLTTNDPPITQQMKKREGWAFTIKKELVKQIPPIPNNLKIYCGDDYIFLYCALLNYVPIKILNSYLFHYGSLTVSELRPRGTRLIEKNIWSELKEKILKVRKN